MALYINSPQVAALYRQPLLLWGICPVLLFWISRMAMIAHRGEMDDDPVVYALRDRMSWACAVLVLLIGLAGVFA